jgi:hypothetical protein
VGREEQQGSGGIMRKGATIAREEIKGGRKKLREERQDRGENEMGGGAGDG